MNPEQLIADYERKVSEIMQRMKERMEEKWQEVDKKFNAVIHAAKIVCAERGQAVKRRRVVESYAKSV